MEYPVPAEKVGRNDNKFEDLLDVIAYLNDRFECKMILTRLEGDHPKYKKGLQNRRSCELKSKIKSRNRYLFESRRENGRYVFNLSIEDFRMEGILDAQNKLDCEHIAIYFVVLYFSL